MTQIAGTRQIPPPAPDKPPLQANVFHALRSANTALMPLFPYVGDGDIVPGATVFWGGENRETSAFNHTNTVDEVAICFAAAKSRMRAGFVHVGSRTHVVGNFFEDTSDPEILMVIVVTQRQAEKGMPQSESLTFFCSKCQTVLLKHEFSSKNQGDTALGLPGYHPPLDTLTEGAICLEPYNTDQAARTCPKCGTLNDPFPVSVWGWDAYYKNGLAAERARRQLLARASSTPGNGG
jgi:hypothetical protein